MQTVTHKSTLRLRRHKIETQKDRFINNLSICQHTPNCPEHCAQRINPDILASWQRSHAYQLNTQCNLPTNDAYAAQLEWEASPLHTAAAPELSHFKHLASQSAIAVAIANPQGKLLWTMVSQTLQGLTKDIHFDVGTNWSEHSHGTNALAVALTTKRPCTVFADEHYSLACRELVCYAAPIIHPQSQQVVGVLDMTMDWQQHTPLAQTAITYMARNIAFRLPAYLPKAELEIHALGSARVVYQGRHLQLSLRQLEILCILTLYPAGMSLDTLHQALCGNESTHPSTVKTILTQLRHLLGGNIASHPYRLLPVVWADFIELSTLLRQHRTADALKLYHGEFLPTSTAPALEVWRHHLEADMENLLYHCTEAQLLIDNADHLLRTPMIRERLIELLV